MRSNLTFLGFLRQYVKELSGYDTVSIQKLVSCCESSPKLREPLFLFAVFSGQLSTLQNALSGTDNIAMQSLCNKYGSVLTLQMLEEQNPVLPERILRVWKSYVSVRDRTKNEYYIKDLMRKQVKELLVSKSVSAYKICKALNLNQGNVSSWLNKGDMKSISYTNAERFLDYLSSASIC